MVEQALDNRGLLDLKTRVLIWLGCSLIVGRYRVFFKSYRRTILGMLVGVELPNFDINTDLILNNWFKTLVFRYRVDGYFQPNFDWIDFLLQDMKCQIQSIDVKILRWCLRIYLKYAIVKLSIYRPDQHIANDYIQGFYDYLLDVVASVERTQL